MNILKNIAEAYFEHDLPVVPLDKNKQCFIENWNKLGESVLSPKFDSYWKSSHGIGLVCGKPSGVIALDLDTFDKDLLEKIKAFLPPPMIERVGNKAKTPTQFFRYNGERTRRFTAIDVEILAGNEDHGSVQTALPPTIHPNGYAYEWVGGRGLLDIDIDDLTDFPSDLLAFLESEDNKAKKRPETSRLQSSKSRCRHGSHNYLSKIVGGLYIRDLPFDTIVERLLKADENYNRDSGYTYFNCPKYSKTHLSKKENAERFVSEFIKRNQHRISVDRKYQSELENGFTFIDEEKEKPVRTPYRLWEYIRDSRDMTWLPNMKMYAIWNGTHYEFVDRNYPRALAQEFYDKPTCTKNNERAEFAGLCEASNWGDEDDFKPSRPGLINLKNGVLDYMNDDLMPHDKAFKFTTVLNCEYVKGADAPVWEELLARVCCYNVNLMQAFEEFIGYTISGDRYSVFNKMLILDGTGANGKSTLLRIVRALLGESVIQNIDLERIGDRFGTLSIFNKLLLEASEVSTRAFKHSGMLKRLTGGDTIGIEYKGAGFTTYENIGKIIITYNEMPYINDTSDGMKRRLQIIPCRQDFNKNAHMRLDKPDEHIIEHELPGVLNRCLTAYKYALSKGQMLHLKESDDRIEELIENSNMILSFLKENFQVTGNSENKISTREVYEKYKTEYDEKTRLSQKLFSEKFHKEAVTHGLVKIQAIRDSGGKVTKGYVGLAYKDRL